MSRPRHERSPPPSPAAPPSDPQVPVFEVLPAFEEEAGQSVRPGAVARAVLDERSVPGEQLRLLAARLRALGRDKRLRRIGVVGSSPGEGGTTVALGLARALASDRKARILLLELDLGRPALDRALGFSSPERGLGLYLAGRDDVPLLRRSRPAGFWVLSAGAGTAPRPGALSSPRLATLLRAADRVFDYVVADCPPLLGGADTGVLQDRLDAFVFVVRARHAQREAIQRAAALIRPEQIVGVVLNARPDPLWFGRS